MGRALIGFAERRARDLGLGSVELYTNALMTENLRYYPRLGYVEYDRRSEHGFDRVYFRKLGRAAGRRPRGGLSDLPPKPPLTCHRSERTAGDQRAAERAHRTVEL